MMLVIQASVYGHMGQIETGVDVLDTALKSVEQNEENFWKAELYRTRGELFIQAQAVDMAEESLLQAIDIANRQSGKSFEIKAATSLARLWQGQNRRKAARELLTPIYNWFTEGFDATHLTDAKALLNEL